MEPIANECKFVEARSGRSDRDRMAVRFRCTACHKEGWSNYPPLQLAWEAISRESLNGRLEKIYDAQKFLARSGGIGARS
jgi:hypothetical protein